MTQDNEMKPAQGEVEGFVIIIVFVNVMVIYIDSVIYKCYSVVF